MVCVMPHAACKRTMLISSIESANLYHLGKTQSCWSHDNPNSDLPKEALEAPSLQQYPLQIAASLSDDSEQTCP